MILYIAAVYTNGLGFHSNTYRRFTDAEKAARNAVKHVLDSYHYINKQSYVDDIRRDGTKVFLDSGAFSAHTQGIEVDLEAYCDYIRRNGDILRIASVLDGIGDPLKTYQNQKAMEANGVQVLPCFHYGEDERYLEYYVANYEYITLGGMVPINKQQLRMWLDRIWPRYLCHRDGLPKIKVHGFGLTRVELMARYPWYSVDSSSWVQSAGTGAVMIPGYGNIYISEHSPARKEDGRHFYTYTPEEQEVLVFEMVKRGFDPKRLQVEYISRWAFNMLTYTELANENAPPKPFIIQQDTLF
jgi:hypothetical protein